MFENVILVFNLGRRLLKPLIISPNSFYKLNLEKLLIFLELDKKLQKNRL